MDVICSNLFHLSSIIIALRHVEAAHGIGGPDSFHPFVLLCLVLCMLVEEESSPNPHSRLYERGWEPSCPLRGAHTSAHPQLASARSYGHSWEAGKHHLYLGGHVPLRVPMLWKNGRKKRGGSMMVSSVVRDSFLEEMEITGLCRKVEQEPAE